MTLRVEDLERDLREAIAKPIVRDSFKIKRANMWLSVFSGMFDAEKWAACDKTLDLEALRGRECYAGLDLAQKIDMSALALVFPPLSEDGDWLARLFYWIPAMRLEEKAQTDKPLLAWHKAGLIELAGEERIDYDHIQKRFEQLATRYRIAELGFDPWKATQLADKIEKSGQMVVEVRQGHKTLSESTDELVALVADGRFCYDNNPVLRWNAKNCVAREDENGNRIPSKKRSRGNIDGISATITAMSRALAAIGSAPRELTGEVHFA
ncbi:MAG: hypothetical protein KJO44_06210 [Gemmatimonadetes bacterium]|nr:hypothetical protein [Gemmatimonadota bacterium]